MVVLKRTSPGDFWDGSRGSFRKKGIPYHTVWYICTVQQFFIIVKTKKMKTTDEEQETYLPLRARKLSTIRPPVICQIDGMID